MLLGLLLHLYYLPQKNKLLNFDFLFAVGVARPFCSLVCLILGYPSVLLGTALVAIFNKKDLKDDMSFIFVTKHGIIKKTGADNFAFKNSLLSITLKPDDELVSVIAVSKDIDILVYSKYGFGTRFNTKEIPDTKRMAIGVIGFPLAENDKVIGVQELAKHDDYIFLLTEKGYGKKCSLEVLAFKERRSEPVSLINLKEHDKVLAIINCNNKDYIHVVLKNNIYDIPMKEIKESMKFGIGDKLNQLS